MRKRHARYRGILISYALVAFGGLAQESVPRPAVAVDPVESIIAAFETHDLVALTTNGNEEDHDFWMSLLHTPRFQAVVDDIVVEFGSARYQGVMDRFTSGETVPHEELRKVWQQTTQPHHVSDPPMYEHFFRTVREVNASLPQEDQLRVVLAEPPIDWSAIEDFEDLLPWLQRRFPYEAEVVEQEVLTKNRKALMLSGASHYLNDTPLLNAIQAHGKSLLKIWSTNEEDLTALQPSVGAWPRPSVALLRGTPLGTADIVGFYGASPAPPGPIEEQFDAVLYLGPPTTLTQAQIAEELCSDQEYLDMRLPRLKMAAENGAPGWLEEFSDYCASITAR